MKKDSLRKTDDMRFCGEISITGDHFEFASSISSALESAETEETFLLEKISESEETIRSLTPDCDKLDYILSASSGALCGLIDIFLVGKPGESPIGNITDKWFGERTKDFAKLCGWKDNEKGLKSAIGFLEKKFKIPYDLRGAGDAASFVFDINPKNHHFKSLGHNPTILGLFFSILDQFADTTTFVTGGELIALQKASDGKFELRGKDVPSKLFCGFVNWFGHLISDISGSSGGKTRGMGIPSPFWAWTNDIIAIKRSLAEKTHLNISPSEFDNSINELALEIYNKGYDVRFQVAQAIPVFLNELIVRLIYSIRRLIKYFSNNERGERSFKSLWSACEPFSNATVKRMLTVAHGTFCLVDIGDATVRGFALGAGTFNVTEFVMRLNIVGIGRFAISLYGESDRAFHKAQVEEDYYFLARKHIVLDEYIKGLKLLSDLYDDKDLLTFTEDLTNSNTYKEGFSKSVELAKKRKVDKEEILESKEDIDSYFTGRKIKNAQKSKN